MGKRRDISELYIKKGKTFIKLITLLVRSWAAQQLAELTKQQRYTRIQIANADCKAQR